MGTTADKLARLNETKVSMKAAINDPALGDRFADYPVAITDGKAYIAQKITEKGVTASGSDTFQQLGDKIGAIETGTDVKTVTGKFQGRVIIYFVSFNGEEVSIGYHNGATTTANVAVGTTVWCSQNVTLSGGISKKTGYFYEVTSDFTMTQAGGAPG